MVARENVAAGVAKLKTLQPIVGPRVKSGGVQVVGAIYDLKSGKVEFLPGDERQGTGGSGQ